jgi:hypothetical protein
LPSPGEFQYEYTSSTLPNLWTFPFQENDSSMLDKSDESLTRVYCALANPTRRQIAQILMERGKAGFKDLQDALKISIGALYHQLDSLDGFVAQGNDGKYVLTEDGRAAINAFSTDETITAKATQTSTTESQFDNFSTAILFGRALFNYIGRAPLRSLPLAATVLALGGAISFMTNLEPILLFYLNPTQGITKTWFLLLFPAG